MYSFDELRMVSLFEIYRDDVFGNSKNMDDVLLVSSFYPIKNQNIVQITIGSSLCRLWLMVWISLSVVLSEFILGGLFLWQSCRRLDDKIRFLIVLEMSVQALVRPRPWKLKYNSSKCWCNAVIIALCH